MTSADGSAFSMFSLNADLHSAGGSLTFARPVAGFGACMVFPLPVSHRCVRVCPEGRQTGIKRGRLSGRADDQQTERSRWWREGRGAMSTTRNLGRDVLHPAEHVSGLEASEMRRLNGFKLDAGDSLLWTESGQDLHKRKYLYELQKRTRCF